MRIASLLPSATEIVAALGLGDCLVGVSHECDHPPELAARLPKLTRSAIPHGLSSAEIDREVSERLRLGKSLYLLEEEILLNLKPDLLITQELCDVCAVSYGDVCRLAGNLPGKPQVLSLAPPGLSGIFEDILHVAKACGVSEKGNAFVEQLRSRLEAVRQRNQTRKSPKPRVFAMEWLDPPYAAGHWVPEMIALAGGEEILGRTGEKSFRVTWEQIEAAKPEVILLIPCGYSAEAAADEWSKLPKPPQWENLPAVKTGRVHAMNANAFCSRPGPRVVEGVEILEKILFD